MDSGETAMIEHPENVAFDPRPGQATDFYAFTGGLRIFSTFESISGLTTLIGNGVHPESTSNGTT